MGTALLGRVVLGMKCEECGEIVNLETIQEHLQITHKIDTDLKGAFFLPMYLCQGCGNTDDSLTREHGCRVCGNTSVVEVVKGVRCEECGDVVLEEDFEQHKADRHEEEPEGECCDNCGDPIIPNHPDTVRTGMSAGWVFCDEACESDFFGPDSDEDEGEEDEEGEDDVGFYYY